MYSSVYLSIIHSLICLFIHPTAFPPIHTCIHPFIFSVSRKHLPYLSPVLSDMGYTKIIKKWSLVSESYKYRQLPEIGKQKWNIKSVIRELIEGE